MCTKQEMSGMDRLTEPLPCPFCGGSNVAVFGPVGWDRRFGITHSCRVFYGGSGDFTIGGHTKEHAIAAWNRRASQAAPAPSDGLREAVARRILDDAISSVEDDMRADMEDAEDTGEHVDVGQYEIVLSYETAKTIRAALSASPAQEGSKHD